MNLQRLQSTIDILQGMLNSMQLLAQSELVQDLESSEGFQDLTLKKLTAIQSDLDEYVQSLSRVKDDLENPQANSEFESALAGVFGSSFSL